MARDARLTPSVFYYYKALGVFGEYMRSTQDVARARQRSREFTNTAWDVTGSFVLTGEAASTGITRPRLPFDPPAGNWGALQVVARYAVLDLDDDIFDAGFAAAGASEKAKQFTLGVNWYPASVFKYYLNYERTEFEHGAAPRAPPKTSSCSECSSLSDVEDTRS